MPKRDDVHEGGRVHMGVVSRDNSFHGDEDGSRLKWRRTMGGQTPGHEPLADSKQTQASAADENHDEQDVDNQVEQLLSFKPLSPQLSACPASFFPPLSSQSKSCDACDNIRKDENQTWLGPISDATAETKAVLCLDFDGTVTKEPTYKVSSLLGCHQDDTTIKENLRLPKTFADILQKAKAHDIAVAVITRHPNLAHVQAYLRVLLSFIPQPIVEPDLIDASSHDSSASTWAPQLEDYIAMILCAPVRSSRAARNKDGEILEVAKRLLGVHVAKQLPDVQGVPDSVRQALVPVMLVDDELDNMPKAFQAFKQQGFSVSFAFASPTKDTFVEKIDTFIKSIAAPMLSPIASGMWLPEHVASLASEELQVQKVR